ncbi:MAG: acyl carrier protein [Pseudomonadales bacterium]
MIKTDILAIVQKNMLEILPKLNPEVIQLEASMKDLGANSIDRMDVVIQSMADLSLKIPLIELASVSNIGGLVDLFYEKLQN